MTSAARIARHADVSTALALLSDRRLADLLASATPLGTGIGGTTWLLRVEGHPVFVKRIALTDLERRPEHVRSTANMFGLPVWLHYGLGSPGGSAWRELAAHAMTSDWTLAGRSEHFLLLHHWRVVETTSRTVTSADRESMERDIAFWHDDPAVRERFEALAAASAELVLFLEHVPHNLLDWLTEQADPDLAMVERDLIAATEFLGAQGMQHFDAHFQNVLTDGERLYLTDFGLASSTRFELSRDERRFLADHSTHDRAYVVTQLVNWIVTHRTDAGRAGWPHPSVRNEFVRRCAEGMPVPELSSVAAAIVGRHAPMAVVVNDFYFALYGDSRRTPYPAAEIARV